jgi:hypothetical protein
VCHPCPCPSGFVGRFFLSFHSCFHVSFDVLVTVTVSPILR